MKRRSKEEIAESLSLVRERVIATFEGLSGDVSLEKYSHLVRKNENGHTVWTDALIRAVEENEVIVIPSGTYFVDATIPIPSNRKIIAYGAHIKKVPEMNTLLLRNVHLKDGSRRRIDRSDEDENIAILGGIWEDTGLVRTFHHGLYDKENSMVGVSACMCFINVKGLLIKDIKIIRAGGFGIQVGYLTDGVIENIVFENTVADGVHINGHVKNLTVRNVSGTVADDIVAFNMYDWSASSVAFGPIENVVCENISLAPEGRYKAIRILPGEYFYEDSKTVEQCYLKDVIIKHVRGVNTFKFYFQTPPYDISEGPEGGNSGWGDNIFIDDVELDLYAPIDGFDEYLNSDAVLGSFAAFELGSHLKRIEISNVSAKIYKEKNPASYLICIGPKSIKRGKKEIFDPYINSSVDELILTNVFVNGEALKEEEKEKYVHEIVFDDIYGENKEASFGKIKSLVLKKV